MVRGRRFAEKIVVPIVAAFIGAGSLVGGVDKAFETAPTQTIVVTTQAAAPQINCPVDRGQVEAQYDKHPEAASVPYPATSEVEKQCQVNEIAAALKARKPTKP
jgi:hypothetical protein